MGAIVVVVVGVLVVNYFRNKKEGEILPPVTNEVATPTSGKSYTAAKGDSLWKISEAAYGTGFNWKEIAKENNLTDANQIEVGQKLSIPEVSNKKVITPSEQAISGATYTVVKGDSLWKIAVRAYGDGYQWVRIAKENKLVHPNLIHPGNILTLPR
ncbi:LysM peptidoglycan-binding domain-containing protein [Candidatus Curtissbacteria bacterium]|nr:LysM peptidoglycan-binding domain-containing protein [Candidatus Curtissbacteria bacterium]